MLASITPLGERGRHNRYATTAAWFVTGSAAGGALAGTVAGVIGVIVGMVIDLPALLVGATVASVAVLGAAIDAGWLGVRLPTTRRQVDERWIDRYRGWVYGSGWGVQLGLAFVTVVNSAAVYVAFVCALLTRSVPAGLVIGFTFGIARGLSILLSASIHTPADLRSFHQRFDRRQPVVRSAAVVVMLTLGIAALTAGIAA